MLSLDAIGGQGVPRIVFFNACQAARVRSLVEARAVSQSFAEQFLRLGVEAYLGTFWPVDDGAAAAFAPDLYRKLAGGAALDEAVREARAALRRQEEPDWANYVLYGDGGFKLVTRS